MTEKVPAQNRISTSPSEFLASLQMKVEEDRDLEREKNKRKLRERSVNELKYTDIPFIPDVEVHRSVGRSDNTLRVQVPEHPRANQSPNIRDEYGIFKDNEVILQGDLKGNEIMAIGKVVDIDDPIIRVALIEGSSSLVNLRQQLPPAKNVSIGTVLNTVPYERELEAIQLAKNHWIESLLVGNEPIGFSHQRVNNTRHLDEELYENNQQSEGIKKALQAENLACLQGPPGTGKSRVIIELARRMVIAGNRVLVAAETNAAVDNILVGSSEERLTDENIIHSCICFCGDEDSIACDYHTARKLNDHS